jgi:hypothetical protein
VGTPFGIVAAAGRQLVLRGPDTQTAKQFTLLDTTTGPRRSFRWPSPLNGLDYPAVDPGGRFVALAFADPAWVGGGQQVIDVWLLDTQTATLSQLPGMPASVALKRTNMAWTDDGRLVLLAQTSKQDDIVAVWRPGQRRLALRKVDLPERTAFSDSFASIG